MKAKKVLAMLMASAMIMGTSVTAFAETPVTTGKVTVVGVEEEGAVVCLYQLVTYDDSGSYSVVSAAQTKGYKVGSKDPKIIAALAKDTSGLTKYKIEKPDLEQDGNYVLDNVPVGTYLVLVEGSGSTVYNPMLVSIEMSYPNGATDGSVDADNDYTDDDGTVVYAKSTDNIHVDKVIVDSVGNQIGANGKYDDVYVGTEVYFTISGTIPSYSSQYDNDHLTYTLKDTLGTGLDLVDSVETTIKGQLTELGDDNAVVKVDKQKKEITIEFSKDYILKNGNKTVSITYPAKVNSAASNFDAATNTVNVTYSNSPTTTTEGTPSTTNHYTFDLNEELVKVDDNTDNPKSLSGAEFTLTSKKDTEKVFKSTSDDSGYIAFEGLDAGEYTLVETKAPAGYQLSNKEYSVTITPKYGENDLLESYKVTIKDGEEEIGEFEYTSTNEEGSGSSANIPNTTLSSLPSTGGIGTTIFTIGGCAIMVTAAGLYFATRKKTEK